MKKYFLTIDCEIIEYELKFSISQSLTKFDDYRVIWREGKEEYRNDSAGSFNGRARKNLEEKPIKNWINISKETIDLLGLL
jgi:hypothetical protein